MRVRYLLMDNNQLTAIESRMYAETFEKVAIGIAHVDTQGRWIHANKQLCDFLGYTHEELLAKTFKEITFKDDLELDLYHANELYRGIRESFSIEKRYVHKDGTPIWANLTATAVRNETGEVDYFIAVVEDIVARKATNFLLLESERRFRTFFEKNSSVMLIINPESGMIEDANKAAWSYYGYTREQLIGMPINHINILQPKSLAKKIQKALHENTNYFLFSHRLSSGEIRYVEVHSTPINSDNKSLLFSIIHDITEQKNLQMELEAQKEEFETIFNTSKDGIAVLDMNSNFLDFNEAYLEMTGFAREELLATSCISLSAPEDRERAIEAMNTAIKTGFLVGFEKTCIVKDGKRVVINMTATILPDKERILITTKDITANKEHEAQLIHIAHYDSLTGLPNRVLNSDRLRQAMIQTQRRDQKIAVLYLDLDGFKEVNDRYAHSIGDKLLIALSAQMKQALRDGDTLSRLGGDEFVAILTDLNDTSISLPIIQRLLDAASRMVKLDDITVQVSVSIGATFYPQIDDVDADQLIRQADQAMYEAKQSGKNRYHIFDSENDRTIRTRHENLDRIRQALVNDEFVLYYQPKVNMRTNALIGVEALIRWKHPDKGLVPPLEFLPIIENHPLAISIGEWVINEAILQIQQWQKQGVNLPVSVNVGARQLLQGDFLERLQLILNKHEKFDPSLLEIEMLETSALEDVTQASQIIHVCKTLGIHFALDDFGTGYSSLTYLKQLPVKTLKIDQSFVCNMLYDRNDLAILEGIIGLAKAFDREVIAEGVETLKHGEQLLLLGCELAQGYGVARPMPPENIVEWAKKWSQNSSWVVE